MEKFWLVSEWANVEKERLRGVSVFVFFFVFSGLVVIIMKFVFRREKKTTVIVTMSNGNTNQPIHG